MTGYYRTYCKIRWQILKGIQAVFADLKLCILFTGNEATFGFSFCHLLPFVPGSLASVGTAGFSLVIVLGNTRASVIGMNYLPFLKCVLVFAPSLAPLPSKFSVCLSAQASVVCDQIIVSAHSGRCGERQGRKTQACWQIPVTLP